MVAGERQGRDMMKATRYESYLHDAGFVDVTVKRVPVPGGPWVKGQKMKELGRYIMQTFIESLEAYKKFLVSGGLSREEVD